MCGAWLSLSTVHLHSASIKCDGGNVVAGLESSTLFQETCMDIRDKGQHII